MSAQRLFEFGNHVLDTRDGLDLPRMYRLEVLDKRTLAQSTKNGEIVHFITGSRHTGVIASLDGEGRSIDDMKCLAPAAV